MASGSASVMPDARGTRPEDERLGARRTTVYGWPPVRGGGHGLTPSGGDFRRVRGGGSVRGAYVAATLGGNSEALPLHP